jgi:hypothetical protein
MEGELSQPVFFLSSTIFDFSDLRSALKFYLEQQGCKVLASEFNDFEKPLDVHSYQACLDAISKADYFILLVGSRRGGWFDQQKRVSITQREYQEAYRLQKEGRLRIINFVRRSIWQTVSDWKEFTKGLDKLEIETELKRRLIGVSNPRVEDIEFTASFLSEIGHNKETIEATKGKGEAPRGNWVHGFDTFKDLIDVFATELPNLRPVDQLAFSALLLSEIKQNLASCLIKLKSGAVVSPKKVLLDFKQQTKITDDNKLDEYLFVPVEPWGYVCTAAIHTMGVKLRHSALDYVVRSPIYLEFDRTEERFKSTEVHLALTALQIEIQEFQKFNTSETVSVIYECHPKYFSGSSVAKIPGQKLLGLIFLLQRWCNIIEYCSSIAAFLRRGVYRSPSVFTFSPVEGFQEKIDGERPSGDEVERFIREGYET